VGIGASIFLIAAGAILTFALDVELGGVDLDAIGWILMAAGVLGLIMTALIWGRRRRVVAPATEERVVTREPVEYRRVEERRDLDPPL
jgi:thiosulfate reductase cytochrome b subunit